MKIFSNLKMVTKLVGGFGIVLLLFVCVMTIYHRTVLSTSDNFQNLMTVNVAIAGQSAEIKTLMKQCRIDEKNFLSTFDTQYLSDIEKNIQQITVKVNEIVAKAKTVGNNSTVQKGTKIAQYIDAYAKSFHDLTSAYEMRGFSSDSGLRGKFAEAGKNLVFEMAYVDVEDLYVQMLRIVQLQEYYKAENDPTKLEQLGELLLDYKEIIAKSSADEEMIKDTVKDGLATYTEYLKKLQGAEYPEDQIEYMNEMQDAIQEIDDMFSVVYLPNVKSLLLEIESKEKDYLLFGGESYASKVHHAIKNLFTAVRQSNINKDYKKNSDTALNTYKTCFDNLVKQDLVISDFYAKMVSAIENIELLIEDLYVNSGISAAKEMERVTNEASVRSSLALYIGLGAIIIGLALSFFITRMITIPISKAVLFSRRMSKGNFARKLNIDQKDEIGMLAVALNDIVTNIGSVVKDITNDVDMLAESSVDLKNISLNISNGADDTATKFSTIAGATEEMSSNLNSIATAIEETSANLSAVTITTEDNTSTINEIAKNSDQASSISNEAVMQAKNTSVDMKHLENATDDIGKVIETIAEISEQINLLALNATIEAARAGESGKGFAVVASEIKDLAHQTAQATKSIRTQVESVQNTTNDSIKGIEKISSIITQVNNIIISIAKATREQSTATKEISLNISQGSQGIQDVTENVAQCSVKSTGISDDIAGANQDAVAMSDSSTQLSGSAEELSKLAEKLKLMMNQFEV